MSLVIFCLIDSVFWGAVSCSVLYKKLLQKGLTWRVGRQSGQEFSSLKINFSFILHAICNSLRKKYHIIFRGIPDARCNLVHWTNEIEECDWELKWTTIIALKKSRTTHDLSTLQTQIQEYTPFQCASHSATNIFSSSPPQPAYSLPLKSEVLKLWIKIPCNIANKSEQGFYELAMSLSKHSIEQDMIWKDSRFMFTRTVMVSFFNVMVKAL